MSHPQDPSHSPETVPTHRGGSRRARSSARPQLPARVLVCDREHGELARMIAPVTGPVVACADLEEALRASTRQPFDIAFVGVHEHTETFVGLLQLLRRTLPRTPIILVLEDPSPAARLATLTVRPFYVVVPPVSFDELDAVLVDALAAARRAS